MHLPLSLKIIAIAIFFLVILLIIAIRKRKGNMIVLLAILVIGGVGLGVQQGMKEYNRTNEDLGNVKADVNMVAADLIREYEGNDSLANLEYLGRVVEVTGNIKKIEQDEKGNYTVIMGDTSSLSSVRCSMDTTHNGDAARLTAGSSASMRGACTGFNKDEMGLGSDVILNRCVVITKKD